MKITGCKSFLLVGQVLFVALLKYFLVFCFHVATCMVKLDGTLQILQLCSQTTGTHSFKSFDPFRGILASIVERATGTDERPPVEKVMQKS